jgi:peptidoglycan hydrolase-like protein with peptidoglycan-binding domain
MTPALFLRRAARGAAAAAVATALAATLGITAPLRAEAATPVPAAPAVLPLALEPLASYVPANSCDPTAKPGTAALGKLLTTTYRGTSYAISRTCGVDAMPTSEHYDGRAVDWMNSVRVPQQAAQAKALIAWLTAADAAGNRYANARRLGVMYIIWNNKIWGAYNADRGWRAYSSCASHPERSWDSTCHRDHMHLSLSWEGAMRQTSFWTARVAAKDFGPCRAPDLNWAGLRTRANPKPCPRYARVTAAAGTSKNTRTLVTYSGMRLKPGSTGPVVSAVQRALGVTATGTYATLTKGAVQRLQRRHGLAESGNMNTATWRALLGEQQG